jgi:hypothetical protein
MKKQTFLILIFIPILFSFSIRTPAIIFSTDNADAIVKVEIMAINPGAMWSWGIEEYPVVCKPLKIYKGSLPDTALMIGFDYPVSETFKTSKDSTIQFKTPSVKIGQHYIIFISTKNPGSVNYFPENKSCPYYLLSGKEKDCVLSFSTETETQLLQNLK